MREERGGYKKEGLKKMCQTRLPEGEMKNVFHKKSKIKILIFIQDVIVSFCSSTDLSPQSCFRIIPLQQMNIGLYSDAILPTTSDCIALIWCSGDYPGKILSNYTFLMIHAIYLFVCLSAFYFFRHILSVK